MQIDWYELLLQPFYVLKAFLFSGQVRYFWFYSLSGIAFGYVAHRLSGDRTPFHRILFTSEAWLSRSAINDYGMVIINPLVKFLALTWIVTHFSQLVGAGFSLIESAGVTGKVTGVDTVFLSVCLTVSLFLVDDFLRWALHYIEHRVPVLWEFHKVHHSAESLNFITAERFHPVEILFLGICMAFGAMLVNGIFILFFGDTLTVTSVAGANVLFVAFNVIGGVLRHSPVWLSFGPRLERWLISPAMHQIHHSEDPRHFNKNLGGALAIWDRMFGTLYIPEGRETISYGIGEENREYRSLTALYLLPFVKAWRRLAGGPLQGDAVQNASTTSDNAS